MRPKKKIMPFFGFVLTTLLTLPLLGVIVSSPAASQGIPANPWLEKNLDQGQAVVWYLFHSGWAVRTKNHFLVFDYIGPGEKSGTLSLGTGQIDPAEISGQNVKVFVSHRHSDHFAPEIEAWRTAIPGIEFIWGWPDEGRSGDIRFGAERRLVTLDGLEILNVHHEFDGVPESAFLLRGDGLNIVFAGDHGHSRGLENPVFRSNLEYLADQAPELDFFFTPSFGGEMDAVGILKPRIVFPMHDGGHEDQYAKFAEKLKRSGFSGEIGAARRAGDVFFYSKGGLVRKTEKRATSSCSCSFRGTGKPDSTRGWPPFSRPPPCPFSPT